MLRKLVSNFGSRAMSVLGFSGYLQMVIAAIIHTKAIISRKDLRALDEAMSRRMTVRSAGQSYVVDCAGIDVLANENPRTFGAIREIFIRDCYFGPLGIGRGDRLGVVVDLGANRGIFSLLAAKLATRVISVEAQPKYKACVDKLSADNNVTNIEIVNIFVGGAGKLDSKAGQNLSLEELLANHKVDRVDLLKVDIEGSEFDLVENFSRFDCIDRIAMEVHPEFGDAGRLVSRIEAAGFRTRLFTSNLEPCTLPQPPDFLYAWRRI